MRDRAKDAGIYIKETRLPIHQTIYRMPARHMAGDEKRRPAYETQTVLKRTKQP